MATFAELCVQAPVISHGVPSGYTDWNVAVEVAMPASPTSLLGTFILGTSVLSSYAWYDVTERMRGVQIERGASAGQRFEVGTGTIELDNDDLSLSPTTYNDYFLDTTNVYLGPGTLVRVVAFDTTPTAGKVSTLTLSDFGTSEASVQTDGSYWFSFVNGNDQISQTGTGYNLTSSAINVEISQFPATAGGYVRDCWFGLSDGTGANNGMWFIWQESGILAIVTRLAGVDTTVEVLGSSHMHWQIRESGGTVYFETSYDGSNWTAQRTVTTPAWITNCKASIFTNVTNSSGNLTAANGWHIKNINERVLSEVHVPLFTGLVEQWDESSAGRGKLNTVTLTCVETLSVLAAVDENSLTSVVGAGDTFTQRVQRLADAASWQFGYNSLGDAGYTFQSTDMSQNRLTELYLTADSIDEYLYSGTDGRLTYGGRDTIVLSPTFDNYEIAIGTGYSDYSSDDFVNVDPDTFITANNDDLLLTKVSLARVGGTAVDFETSYLSGFYQKRTYTRNDFITQNPGSNADFTFVSGRILGRSAGTYRPYSVQVDGKVSRAAMGFIFGLDVGLRVAYMYADNAVFIEYPVCSYTTRIRPLNDAELNLTSDVRFGIGEYSRWYRIDLSASAPANNNWASATTITTGTGGTVKGTTAGATLQASEPVPYSDSRSVWYKFTAGATGSITLDTGLSLNRDTTISVYTGASLAALSLVGKDDDSGPALTALKTISVTSGTTYYVRIGCFDYPGSEFVLRWTAIT